MRALILLLVLVSGVRAFAAAGELKTELSQTSAQVNQAGSVTAGPGPSARTSELVGVTSPTLGSHWTLGASSTLSNPQYDQFIIRDSKTGEEHPLSQDFRGQEVYLQGNAVYQEGPHSVSLTAGEDADNSPLAARSVDASYRYSINSGLTALTGRVKSQEQDQPVNSYIARDLTTRMRPRDLHSQRLEASWEQIWNSEYKTLLTVFQGDRFEDRPTHYGLDSRQVWAFNDWSSFRFDAGYLNEVEDQALKDELGRFRVYWLEPQLSFEPVYDYIVQIGYSLVVEQERDRVLDGTAQTGTDAFALGLKYRGRGWSGRVTYVYSVTNTGLTGQSALGGLTWDL